MTAEQLVDQHADELRAMGYGGEVTVWLHRLKCDGGTHHSFWNAWMEFSGLKVHFTGTSWAEVTDKAWKHMREAKSREASALLFDPIFTGA